MRTCGWVRRAQMQLGASCDSLPLTPFSDPPVASWISYVSFMRWGFEGMLQVQFRGNRYPVTISNITINIDGIHVSKKQVKAPVSSQAASRHSSAPSGGGGHEHEPVSLVFVLSGPARSVPGLHGSLLHFLEIHQAEVQSRLVKTSECFSTDFYSWF